MIKIRFNPFSRKKSLEKIKQEIVKSIKNLNFKNQVNVLSLIIRDLADKNDVDNDDLIYTKLLLDRSIDYLLDRYLPEEAILHLGFIAEAIVKRNPNLKGKIEQLTSPKVPNGVV